MRRLSADRTSEVPERWGGPGLHLLDVVQKGIRGTANPRHAVVGDENSSTDAYFSLVHLFGKEDEDVLLANERSGRSHLKNRVFAQRTVDSLDGYPLPDSRLRLVVEGRVFLHPGRSLRGLPRRDVEAQLDLQRAPLSHPAMARLVLRPGLARG